MTTCAPLLMPGAGVSLRVPADLVARFQHRLATEPDWAVENQFLPVWLDREPVAVERARAALLDRARYLARCENDATEYHTWCIAPHALRVAAYATWLENISPWTDADRAQLGRDLVQFCRQHVVAVLSGRAPSADNQFLSMSLTCGIVGEGLLRLGVERDSAAWLAQLGLDRARQWIGLMPPDGYSGEGSTYQMEVVSPLAMWLSMLLIEQEGRAVFEKKFGPNGTSLRAILELHRDLASPSGCAPGWDNHGWTTYYTLSPLVYLCRLTGEPLPVDLIRQNWDEYDTICWRTDDRLWALLCWPERAARPVVAPKFAGWTRRHCAAVIDHRPTRSRLMLCADRTSDTVQAVGRYQCNPNHVLWEVNGTAIFGDGGRDPDARLAGDVAGLRARLEPARLEMILQQYGSLENFLAAVDTGLIGQANTVVVAGQREWFPFDAVAGQCVFEQRVAERHMVAFDSRAIYDPALPLRVARRFIAMDAAGIGWMVDDYRADESLAWDWQMYLPPVEVPVTLGWPVGETHRYESQPHYPKPLPHGVWPWSGSRRLVRSFAGKELRTATVLLPFVAENLRVQATGAWSWEATWDGGGASVSVPDLGAEPVAFAACPSMMSGTEPPWPADPACAKITDAEFLARLENPAPAAWRETVRAVRELMARGNRAVAPAAMRLLQDDRQRYHVHSVACAALTQIRDPAVAAVLRRWTWTPEPNIAARARGGGETEIRMKMTWLLLWMLATPVLAAEVALTSLTPVKAEFGTLPYPDESLRPHVQPHGAEAGKFDTGSYYSGNWFWPEARKIVKGLPGVLPEPKDYRSRMTDVFFVGGKPKTGVGLWAQVTMMYHQLDYAIPTGAKKFSALAFTTDDSHGYMPDWTNYTGWQEYTVQVLVDGRVVKELTRNKAVVPMGSGELLGEIEVDLPAGAKMIAFRLQASPAIDWNKNSEVVLSEAGFRP